MAGVCVFCGSRSGDDPRFTDCARRLGEYLARRGHTTIYGGGGTGVMGELADSVLAGNGTMIGVIPQHLVAPEIMHQRVADMRVTRDMHERKALMHLLTDVYVVLPGGFGTMEELFEAVTWAQLDLHTRPIAILNVNGLFDGLFTLLDAMESNGFLSARCRSYLNVFHTTDDLLTWLDAVTGFSQSDRISASLGSSRG